MEAILQEIEALGEEIPADILEELEKEIRRNEEANRMAKQMERTALAAKERALQSQMAMKEMVQKYEDIQAKVFDARSTLKETTEALERQTKLTRDVIDLRERTQRAALKHIQNEAKLEAAASTVAAAVIANETDSHILGRPVNSGGDSDGPSVSSSPKSSPHRPFSNPSSFSNSQHAQTVQRLQAKLAMKCIQQRPVGFKLKLELKFDMTLALLCNLKIRKIIMFSSRIFGSFSSRFWKKKMRKKKKKRKEKKRLPMEHKAVQYVMTTLIKNTRTASRMLLQGWKPGQDLWRKPSNESTFTKKVCKSGLTRRYQIQNVGKFLSPRLKPEKKKKKPRI